jgi:uncharacterized membrane-anchored protein
LRSLARSYANDWSCGLHEASIVREASAQQPLLGQGELIVGNRALLPQAGTATGDMTASTLGLGYFASGWLFAGLMALPALAYRLANVNAIAAFWIAYILTRPLGASFADWVGRSRSLSGLGLGTGFVSLGLTIVIIVLVGYVTVRPNASPAPARG